MTEEPTPETPMQSDDPTATRGDMPAPDAPAAVPAPPTTTPPPSAWAVAAPAAAVTGPRTGLAGIAGIILMVLGGLGLIVGALAFAGTAFFSQLAGDLGDIPGLPAGTDAGDVVAGAFAVLGVIVVAYSLAYVVGGIGVWRGRGWGRVIGLVVSILSGLIWLPAVTSSNIEGTQVVPIALLAVHVYVIVVLAVFWRSRASA